MQLFIHNTGLVVTFVDPVHVVHHAGLAYVYMDHALVAGDVGLMSLMQHFDNVGLLGLTLSDYSTDLLGLALSSAEDGHTSVPTGLTEFGKYVSF